MDGSTWTQNAKIAHSIDRSQDLGSGMVALTTWDPEEFEELSTELTGICTDQKRVDDRTYEYHGMGDDTKDWAVQLALLPHAL